MKHGTLVAATLVSIFTCCQPLAHTGRRKGLFPEAAIGRRRSKEQQLGRRWFQLESWKWGRRKPESGRRKLGRRLQQQLQLSDLSGRELLLPKPTVSVPDRQWSHDAAIRGSGDSGLFDARGSAELSPHGAVQFAPVGDDHHKQAAGDEQHSGRPDGNGRAEARLTGEHYVRCDERIQSLGKHQSVVQMEQKRQRRQGW